MSIPISFTIANCQPWKDGYKSHYKEQRLFMFQGYTCITSNGKLLIIKKWFWKNKKGIGDSWTELKKGGYDVIRS